MPFAIAELPSNTTFSDTERIVASISQISGYMSLCVWLFAQLPQIIENHLNQSVDGVSLLFLLSWMTGDVTNLIGCLLTLALPFQTLLASYYCFIDCILSLQFWYYTRVYPYQKVHHNLLQSPDMMRPQLGGFHANDSDLIPLRTNRFKQLPPPMSIVAATEANPNLAAIGIPQNSSFTQKLVSAFFIGSFKGANGHPLPANALDKTEIPTPPPKSNPEILYECVDYAFKGLVAVVQLIFHVKKEELGRFLAWTCSFCYVSSRTPQILENYRKKSTKGISIYLFLLAMLGNTFYTICIVSDLYLVYYDNGYMDEWAFRDAFYSQLPFIVGSAGTVTFDCCILFQCWLYKAAKPKSRIPRLRSKSKNRRNNGDYAFSDDEELDDGANFRKKKAGGKHKNSIENFKKPDWYTNNYVTSPSEDHMKRNSYRTSDSTSLLQSGQHSTYSSIIGSPAPSHYISGGTSIKPTPIGKSFSNTFQSLSNSFRNSTVINSTKSPHSASSSVNYPSNSPLSTSLIPLIIGTYSSVSKKMKNEAKIPFLPSDFLQDDFLGTSHEMSRDQDV